jgi:hypothetical protein
MSHGESRDVKDRHAGRGGEEPPGFLLDKDPVTPITAAASRPGQTGAGSLMQTFR